MAKEQAALHKEMRKRPSFPKTSLLFRDRRTVVCRLRSCAANLLNKQRHLCPNKVWPGKLNIMPAAVGDDSAAARGKLLEVFLHLVEGLGQISRLLSGDRQAHCCYILRENQNRKCTIWAGVNCLMPRPLEAVHFGSHGVERKITEVFCLQYHPTPVRKTRHIA